jgi:ATP-dependent DNA helicase RecQ
MNDVQQALKTHFGFDQFLPGQERVIERLLDGRSAAAVFPTGGGKSLCYQLPALMMSGVTLVVSPLIALMKDQIDALARRGIAAARLDSTLTVEQYREVMQSVRAGKLRLLYVAPERFQNERFREAIQGIPVALFAVDEAHCISEWGHNFRPDYLKLVEFSRRCKAERLLALTATATPQVLDDICRAFDIEADCVVRNSSYRPNLTLLTTLVTEHARDERLSERLRERPAGPTIVYVTLQRTAEELAARLAKEKFAARAYHAGMEDDERAAVQDWFMKSAGGIVVATIAFGMGIDKANIRYVYHYNMPKSLENYSQEVGRAGRDGLPAVCEMLFCPNDLGALENFAWGDLPTRDGVRRFVQEIFSQGEEFDVGHQELAGLCDIRPLVVRTLLTYLELDGLIEGGTPFYSTCRFQPLKSSQAILAEFEGERRQFLERLLKFSKKGKTWFTIDLEAAAKALAAPRDHVVRALDYLAEQGWLKLEAAGTRHRYRRLSKPADLAATAVSLFARCEERRLRDLARLEEVIEYFREKQCKVAALCRHFGEDRPEHCGHCSACLEQAAAEPSVERTVPPLDEAILEQARNVRREYPILSDPTIMTRWLCGITSPALTKAKLSSHRLFGALAEQPFGELFARLQA